MGLGASKADEAFGPPSRQLGTTAREATGRPATTSVTARQVRVRQPDGTVADERYATLSRYVPERQWDPAFLIRAHCCFRATSIRR